MILAHPIPHISFCVMFMISYWQYQSPGQNSSLISGTGDSKFSYVQFEFTDDWEMMHKLKFHGRGVL